MPPLTLDASVWISAFTKGEPEHAASLALVDALLTTLSPLVEPTLFYVEIGAAIARRRDSAIASEVAQAVLALPSVHWVALDDVTAQHALSMATQLRLRGADAVYAAVARLFGCSLVSLDHEHLSRLAPIVSTITPTQAIELLASP